MFALVQVDARYAGRDGADDIARYGAGAGGEFLPRHVGAEYFRDIAGLYVLDAGLSAVWI